MDVHTFLNELRQNPQYSDQIVYVHEIPAREAEHAHTESLSADTLELTQALGIGQLYAHQAEAIQLADEGRDLLIATGTASGKTLCYTLPILKRLQSDPKARALLLFPTKALCQDQFKGFRTALEATNLTERLAGVYDGDSPSTLRRRLRDHASALFSNPDMAHASLLSQHARWADFLANLRFLVLDELHVYNGLFGSNMALLLQRLFRLCEHYGSRPQIIGCSATIANPRELGERLTHRDLALVDRDSSPRGKKTYVLWNPPRVRATTWRSRRSANVEAHELMAQLVAQGVPTITFSKAKMTAEKIHRYVTDKLLEIAPQQVSKVTPYRGGYLPEERRAIEERLFKGELLGVSTTPALELGIDVGGLEACVVVGYPGTRASFFQQAGRAGRKEADSVVFLIGLDTSINQYIMTHPEYIFERSIEEAVIEPENPYVVMGHLRCAAHELALSLDEAKDFGPNADVVLKVLEDNRKLRKIRDRWYHAASETPQHEVSLRDYADANVVIEDIESGNTLGEINRYDSQPILHPGAIYMHQGDTYVVKELDLDRNIARVQKVEVGYYTQPLGGTDIHHIDHQLREKEFGTGKAYWGEVTAYFNTFAYERIHFYELDAISVHGVDLPQMVLETMAFWIVPPEDLLVQVRESGLDAHSGLRGIGYGTRMMLPLFITCDTLSFSHTVGSANSPWRSVFVYERYPHGLGFTEKAYDKLHLILPAVLENIKQCICVDGCPCCVGKPLRQATTWNVERGEGSIPSKAAARMILEGMMAEDAALQGDDIQALTDTDPARLERLERVLRRRLERMREPKVFHPITPEPEVRTRYPDVERPDKLGTPDVERRSTRRRDFDRDLHKRIAKRIKLSGLSPTSNPIPAPPGMHTRRGVARPTDFAGRPEASSNSPRPDPPPTQETEPVEPPAPPRSEVKPEPAKDTKISAKKPVVLGDSLAARARKLRKPKKEKEGTS